MIIGTAGHIDHGKTSLVRALTGIDTDRLREEKARGITIDLGFAYVPLPDGGTLGFVDVPGHERLVHTMIAGAASIDLALLVVAADDGVMPQTREHLAILELLGIGRAIVALTKTDLVDAERALEVELAIAELLAATRLADAEIVPVSCRSGAGITALRTRLLAQAGMARPRAALGAFRFSVDRSFTLAGAGTVVTGSVVAGEVRVGDAVQVLPDGIAARVRGLHAGNHAVEHAQAGARCALNLAGAAIRKDAIGRGDWVVAPGHEAMSARCDIALHVLPGAPAALKHWTPVLLHHGAAQVTARVVLLAPEVLRPGERGLAQLVLERPRPLRHGDKLVLRDAGALRTIAGGHVLDPSAPERHRRRPARLAGLHALQVVPASDALHALLGLPPYLWPRAVLLADWGVAPEVLLPALRRLPGPRGEHVTTEAASVLLMAALSATLAAWHASNPAAAGLAPEALRLALPERLPRDAFAALVAAALADGVVAQAGHLLRAPSHRAGLGGPEAALWARLLALLEAAPYQPPRLAELAQALAAPEITLRRACKNFARAGLVLEPTPDRFFLPAAMLDMARMAAALSAGQGFSAAQFRDRLGNGRQAAIEVLEYFDRRGLTVRRGDLRRVIKDPEVLFGASTASG